ncbi:MAG: CBS domain-containing protein [Verrucomicrobia bacterium]|nr:CBS domain-containing protein [Verrucomicrobiota bacterium]
MMISGTIDSILKAKVSPLWSVSPETTVFDAITLMAEKNIGSLLVTADDKLIGIVSERDYTRKVALKGKSSKTIAVREIVSTPVVTVGPGHTVEECLRLMTERRVRHLPVLEGDKILGVVSIGDLVNWVISAQNVALEQMENYIAGNYYS